MCSPRPHYYIGRVAQNSIESQTHVGATFPRPTCGALGLDQLRRSNYVLLSPCLELTLDYRKGPKDWTALSTSLSGRTDTCNSGSSRCRPLYGNSRASSSPNLRIPSRSRICLKRPLYRFILVTVGVAPIRALKVRSYFLTPPPPDNI